MDLTDVKQFMPQKVDTPNSFNNENGRWTKFVESPLVNGDRSAKINLAKRVGFKNLVDRMLKKTFLYWNSGNIFGHAVGIPMYEQLGASSEEKKHEDIDYLQYIQPGISFARGLRFVTICAHRVQQQAYNVHPSSMVIDTQLTASILYLYNTNSINNFISENRVTVLYKSESKAVTRPPEYRNKIFEAYFDTREVSIQPDIIVVGDPFKVKDNPYRLLSYPNKKALMKRFPKSKFIEITGRRASHCDPSKAARVMILTGTTPGLPGTVHTEEHNRGYSMFMVLSAVMQATNTEFEQSVLNTIL